MVDRALLMARCVDFPKLFETDAVMLRIGARAQPEARFELAAEIAANAPISLRQAKKAIDGGYHLDLDTAFAFEAEAYNATLCSEDRIEGLRAFAERRPPRYQGR